MDHSAQITLPNVRRERLQKIAKLFRHYRNKMHEYEEFEAELGPLLVGIKPQNMATQAFLYDPEGEKQRQKLALLFLSKKMVVPIALAQYLNADFVIGHLPRSRIGKS